METVTIFNQDYKVTERVERMLNAVRNCNNSIQMILTLALISKDAIAL